ncbi:MAG: 50S ribosomal protein L3 [Nitrospirota bacterium]
MINGILGEKLGMTQVYREDGSVIAVTVVEGGPCWVTQKKTIGNDGYNAIQISFREVKEKKVNKPMSGHFKKTKVSPMRYQREVKGDVSKVELGQMISIDIFEKGEKVDVTSISKGKGFAGVVKRYHFKGGPATHGSMFHRVPGSIGNSAYPSRVWKNKKMPGQMGNKKVTIKRLEIIDIRKEDNLLFIKGAIPGSKGSIIEIKKI